MSWLKVLGGFLLGVVCTVAGGYLFFVWVYSNGWGK